MHMKMDRRCEESHGAEKAHDEKAMECSEGWSESDAMFKRRNDDRD
jgi:hypothetical protein